MATLLMIVGSQGPYLPFQTTPISPFFVTFHMFIVGEHRDFKFATQDDHIWTQPTDDKLSLQKLRHMMHFKLLEPHL